jgi:hypothetical protein
MHPENGDTHRIQPICRADTYIYELCTREKRGLESGGPGGDSVGAVDTAAGVDTVVVELLKTGLKTPE